MPTDPAHGPMTGSASNPERRSIANLNVVAALICAKWRIPDVQLHIGNGR
jgi:hypothetical protein